MQVKDLVVTGDARIIGNLYTKDGIASSGGGGGGGDGSGLTYTLSKSGSTITLTGSDGSTSSVQDTNTDNNTTYTLSQSGTNIVLTGSNGSTTSAANHPQITISTSAAPATSTANSIWIQLL